MCNNEGSDLLERFASGNHQSNERLQSARGKSNPVEKSFIQQLQHHAASEPVASSAAHSAATAQAAIATEPAKRQLLSDGLTGELAKSNGNQPAEYVTSRIDQPADGSAHADAFAAEHQQFVVHGAADRERSVLIC